MYVPNFRENALYDRSLDLFCEVYDAVKQYGEYLEEQESFFLRKRALQITRKVMQAVIQRNLKMKIKLLNEAKNELLLLLEQVYQLIDEQKLDDLDAMMIDCYGTQILKLIHYHFGQLKKSNGKSSEVL